MKRKILNYNNFILLLYLFLALITIYYHEQWYDEAQAWAIAENLSIGGIFKFMPYEGHSCLFYIYLKFLILLGISYRSANYFNIIFGLIGTILFLYKSPFNKLINTLFILSPAFIYCCPIFLRPYIFSLFFFILICILYKDRYKHPYIFGIILFLFINTHILTIIFIGSLMLYEIYEYFFKKKEYFKERMIIGIFASLGVLFFAIQLLGAFSKRPDILREHGNLLDSFYFFSNIFKGLFINNIIMFIIVFILLFLLLKKMFVNKKIRFIFLFNTICYILFSSLIYPLYDNKVIYIVIYILFCFWLYYEEDKKECNRLVIWLLLLSCINSFNMISKDIFNDYSYTKKAAEYFLNDDRDNVKIASYSDFVDIRVLLDDRYKLINILNDEEYTYYNHLDDFSRVNDDLKEYLIDRNIDYVITSSIDTLNTDKINDLVEEEFLTEELVIESTDCGILVIYKVNNVL